MIFVKSKMFSLKGIEKYTIHDRFSIMIQRFMYINKVPPTFVKKESFCKSSNLKRQKITIFSNHEPFYQLIAILDQPMNAIRIVILNRARDGTLISSGSRYFDTRSTFLCKTSTDGLHLVRENDGGKSGDSFQGLSKD